MQLSVRVQGDREVTQALAGLASRTGPPGRGRLLAAIGQRVALRHMPDTIRKNRPGWPRPSGRYHGWRAGGTPLVDDGYLSGSWAWQVPNQHNVRIWTAKKYAKPLDEGKAIRPRNGRFLLIPLSPPLTKTEAKGFPMGKAAIRARYPGSRFLLKGPEGPGIYRPIRYRAGQVIARTGRGGQYRRTKSHRYVYRRSIERIAAARRLVQLPAFRFGHWRKEWMPDLVAVAQEFVVTGRGPAAPPSGGNPDKGGARS